MGSSISSGDFSLGGLGLCLAVHSSTIPRSVPENSHYLSSLMAVWVDGARRLGPNLGLNASGTTTVALSHGWQLALAVAGSPFEAADQSTSGHLPAALVFREEFSHCGRWAPAGRKHNCPFKGCAFTQKVTSSASPSQNASQGSVNSKSKDRDWREKWHRVCGCLLLTTSGLPGPLPHLVLSCSAAGCISPHLG